MQDHTPPTSEDVSHTTNLAGLDQDRLHETPGDHPQQYMLSQARTAHAWLAEMDVPVWDQRWRDLCTDAMGGEVERMRMELALIGEETMSDNEPLSQYHRRELSRTDLAVVMANEEYREARAGLCRHVRAMDWQAELVVPRTDSDHLALCVGVTREAEMRLRTELAQKARAILWARGEGARSTALREWREGVDAANADNRLDGCSRYAEAGFETR
ncbi:hypothetical protein LTR53_010401 [Teratosphaeriaceae sp. CCFEE 6253]|nr:hypothetical protein LTR53_010401 [Teratosphaeriaceae sp. CCFEE 6253]